MKAAAPPQKLALAVLDFLFPPRCLACGNPVDRMGSVCAPCWKRLTFITQPCCARCGLPFDYRTGPDALCGPCSGETPPFDRARAALAYDDGSRHLLIGLKHDRVHSVDTLAEWMLRCAGPLAAEADLVCAVPLHRWRLARRGYNQAALLAHAVAKRAGTKSAPALLRRHRRTASQGGLSRSGRLRNVRGAFSVAPGWASRVKGARVLLVDDVWTTGATIGECCRILRRAGAARVDVLCAARVIR